MKSIYPHHLEELISTLKTLPGIGPKGAERLALAILKWPTDKVKSLATNIYELHERIKKCSKCGNISEAELCNICTSPSRNNSILCIVEDSSQIPAIENSGFYNGLYHILGGKLSPLENKGPDTLTVNELINRIKNNDDTTPIKEVILALSQDVEGQATSFYIADRIKNLEVSISTLARGLPAGADISFANSATIRAAINGRRTLKD